VTIPASSWTPHPLSRTVRDVGIITLAERAPFEIPRAGPLRIEGAEINVPNYPFGYGLRGYGATGRDTSDGNKRGGRNRYEATGTTKRVTNLTLGGASGHQWLFSDFDSGLAENDGFGFHFGQADLGYGGDEVYATSGDSGGPMFIASHRTFVVAGVVSSGARYENGPANPNSDVDSAVNGTWGQFSVDARIAESNSLAFIESFIEPELERVSGSIELDGTNFVLTADIPSNSCYYVRFTPSLTEPSWSSFANGLSGTNGTVSLTVSPGELDSYETGFFSILKERE
jgi:hypothetical protein